MIDLVFVLALLCVLAASALSVVLAGAGVYRRTAGEMRSNFEMRTTLRYVSEKIRQHDAKGAVTLGTLGENPALVLLQGDEGQYVTYLYCMDGALYELFARADVDVLPENGQRVTEVREFSVRMEGDSLLRLECTDSEGTKGSCLVALRSEA